MSKTIRKVPLGNNYHRNPKGAKQAKIAKCRYKAIPPDSYDDINHGDDVFLVYKLINQMNDNGLKLEVIYNKLKGKGYKVSMNLIKEAINR